MEELPVSENEGGSSQRQFSSKMSEWACRLCQHLQRIRQSHAPLSSSLPRLLGPAVDRHLRGIVDTAIKIQRRSRRNVLTVDDLNFVLSLQSSECVYGFASA
eukprot:CAMPEP_0185751068 /NCGR_PEP_ID=MMETSP1174-20130828/9824_1 /TAXON_ID=35687 /ORGANISM="Dictyocha speculum, Strain CCMP1381" /LENGTH=101 /DNA_ID=CAMNT_0028427867 /DNA_START=60 /DNA_END=362 /DNA_ORIENTATION=-